ncbi:MAG: AMP-binding protein [Bacteroidales bacterium]|jgi:acyl-CoA synthetase (AMP-forming)/AMP-acid ligase II
MNVFDYFFEFSGDLKKDFVLGPKETVSYSTLYSKSNSLAQYIESNFDEEEKILLISPNNVFFLIVYLAILKSGRVCVPLNPEIEPENLKFIRDECKAKSVFIHDKFIGRHNLTGLTSYAESQLTELTGPVVKDQLFSMEFDDSRCAEIIYTSGSTGEPKGVMISHKNIIANTESIIEYLKLTDSDIIEVVMPFYYCYGLSLLHTHLRAGGSVVLNNTFVFIGSVLNDLEQYKCTGFAGVPSHFQILLRKSDSFKTKNFPDMRYVTQAGGKLHTVFISEFMEVHPEIDFCVMYGQTEATARLSYLPPADLKSKLGSIGKGIPDVELKVVNEKGEEIRPGETGEIIAKGNNIMMGYLNDEAATNQTIRDGWLHTGDLGTIDEDGYIFLTARSKEIIKVRGKRISPKEIEEVLVTIPEVIDCTIFPVNDDLLGEAVKAVITIDKSSEDKITVDFIREYCAARLAAYKIPSIIELKNRVAISSTGKKIKSELN